MKKELVGIMGTLIFLISVSVQGQVPAGRSQSELQIRAVLEKQCAAWNKGDIERYMDGYWCSDSLLFTSGGEIERGWKKTLEKYRRSYDSPGKMGTLVFSDIQIFLLSERSAWALGHWKLRREPDAPEGLFTLIFKKFDEGWKIIHDHTSSRK